jgi:chaperonin GroEL (HSP60 family)
VGGVALLRASEGLKKLRTQNDDQKTGVEIVRKALSWPKALPVQTQFYRSHREQTAI